VKFTCHSCLYFTIKREIGDRRQRPKRLIARQGFGEVEWLEVLIRRHSTSYLVNPL